MAMTGVSAMPDYSAKLLLPANSPLLLLLHTAGAMGSKTTIGQTPLPFHVVQPLNVITELGSARSVPN